MTQFGNIFSDLKVLDLASYIAGPAATTILSDFGANVIKVAPPPGQRAQPRLATRQVNHQLQGCHP